MGTYKKIMRASLLFFSLLFLGSCTEFTNLPSVSSLTINQEILQDYYDIGDFEITELELLVLMSDGTEIKIVVNETMISEEDLAKLLEPGQHDIRITYQNQDVQLRLNLLSTQSFNTFYKIYLVGIETGLIEQTYEAWINSIDGFAFEDDRNIILRVAGELIQWQYLGDDIWNNLFDLQAINDFISTPDALIKNVDIDSSGSLIITYQDNSTKNLGQLIQTFIVSFYDDQENLIETQTVLYGGSALAPLAPEKEGYIFSSWNQTFNEIKEDLIITAIYESSTYTITFDPQNGDPVFEIDGVFHNETINLPTPYYIDYIFEGWFIDQEGSLEFTADTPITSSMTLYAHWLADTPKVNTFYILPREQTNHTITIEIYITGLVSLNGYDLRLNFDSELLNYHTHTNALNNVINTSNDGVISFNYSDVLNTLTETTLILTVTFDVLSSAETTFSITVIEAIYIDALYQVSIVETNTSDLIITVGGKE